MYLKPLAAALVGVIKLVVLMVFSIAAFVGCFVLLNRFPNLQGPPESSRPFWMGVATSIVVLSTGLFFDLRRSKSNSVVASALTSIVIPISVAVVLAGDFIAAVVFGCNNGDCM